jgi:exo-beta-1,3-glucanase (GH17 family)
MTNERKALWTRRVRSGVYLPLLLLACASCSSSSHEVGLAGSGGTSSASGGAPGGTAVTSLVETNCNPPSLPEIPETCPGGVGDGGKRCIPDRVLQRRAVCYSGYRTGETPNAMIYPTADQIKQDLELLTCGGFTFIRLFDASQHAATVLQVIHDNGFDIKVQLGVWISGPKATMDTANQDQISKAVALATSNTDVVVGVSVGNETLDTWSSVLTPAADLAGYIQQVRSQVPQPVTTDDMYPPFEFGDGYDGVLAVAQVVDYLSIHAYAALDADFGTWDYQQLSVPAGPARAQAMMAAAVAETETNIAFVSAAMKARGLDLPIVIGEAGWRSRNANPVAVAEKYYSHPVNQKMFFDGLTSWVYGATKDSFSPKGAFYFEAFDEPWKTTDDGWGLFDVNRVPNYVEWTNYPDLKPTTGPTYTDADALYYTPPASP